MSRFMAGLRAAAAAAFAFVALGANAGGPLSICNNQAVRYPGSGTVTLNYDLGNLGSRTKAQADAIVTNAVSLWTNVGTATVALQRGGDLPVDVGVTNYGTYFDNFSDGINPVIYDTDGSIVDDLLGIGAKGSVLGFAGSAYNGATCQYVEGQAVISGYLAVTDATMGIVIAHEVGHMIGLDHTQLDSSQGLAQSNYPLMYPIAYRSTASLHPDDAAAVSALYPDATVNGTYGQLTGNFRLADGVTPVLGANIWAQENTTHLVYSAVSDYLMQNNGAFKLLLPAGTYTLHAEAIDSSFTGGSSVGPYSDTYPTSASFQPPLYSSGGTPMAPVTLGGGTPTNIVISAGCAATAAFRFDGTGSVSGNCVSLASATVSLASSASTSVVGQPVTFTATVSGGSGTATGTVAFRDAGTAITGCSAAAISGGAATCTTSSLAIGSHSITAQYSGNAVYATATSAAIPQSIVAGVATVALGSSANPSISGQAVTFTANVTGASGTPTGTVVFHDSATTLCSGFVTLSAGVASCTTSALTVGSHSISASYAGDAVYGSATSAVLAQTVSSPPSFALTVTRAGTGSGIVTSSPGGISCGATCSAPFVQGTAVTLIAEASPGSQFSGWSGACTGTGACTVTLAAASSVTASFATGASTGPSIQNGGFESPAGVNTIPTGWTGQGGMAGNASLAYFGAPPVPEGLQVAYIYQTTGGLDQTLQLAAGSYVLTFRATSPTAWTPAPLIVRVNGAQQASISPATGSWGTYTVGFTAPQAGAYVLELGSNGTGMVFVDNVRIAAGQTSSVTIQGGGFESPVGMNNLPSGWTGQGATTTNAALAYFGAPAAPEGAQVAYLNNTTAGMDQTLQLAAGTYAVTFRATLPTTWTPAPLVVRVNGAQMASIVPSAGSWGTYTVNFTAPQAGAYVLELGSNGTGMVFVDDVRIAAAQAISLQNGGFESPSGMNVMPSGWTGQGGTVTNASLAYFGAPTAPEGVQAAFIYQTSAGLDQTLQLAAGNYALRLRATAPTAWTPAPLVVRVDGVQKASIAPSAGSWGTYTVNFSVAQTGSHVLELGSNGTGMVFVDQVSIATAP